MKYSSTLLEQGSACARHCIERRPFLTSILSLPLVRAFASSVFLLCCAVSLTRAQAPSLDDFADPTAGIADQPRSLLAALPRPDYLGGTSEVFAVYPVRPPAPLKSRGVHWRRYFSQEFLEVSFQMGERLAMESKTRAELDGPYFKDWFYVVKHYRYSVWNDGDKFFTSNIGHPAQGAIIESIFWQNDDRVRFADQDFRSGEYRHALMQAALLCAADAVQWKLGPLSEATIGHVGLPTPRQGDRDRTGANDLVLNETGGTVMMMGFQWLDKHVQRPLERRLPGHPVAINALRIFTNPPASMANLFRFRAPWYRDNRDIE